MPFVPILPPGSDSGFDLVTFLGFLFNSLELAANPTINLLYDSKVFLDSPIIPGIGNADMEIASRKKTQEVFEKFWQAIDITLSEVRETLPRFGGQGVKLHSAVDGRVAHRLQG